MKRIFILVCCAMIVQPLVAQVVAEKVVTFEEALVETLENNASIRAAESGIKAAEQERRSAMGLRAPTIMLNGTYAWLGDDVAVDLNGVKRGVIKAGESLLPNLDPALGEMLQGALTPIVGRNWELILQRRSFASVGGSVTLPIFTGGRINVANRAAKIGEKMAANELQGVRGELTSQLVERYFGLLLASHAVEVRREVVVGIARHLTDAEALERNGMIAASERLYVEYKLSEAYRDLRKAQLAEHTAQQALANTLGGVAARPVTAMFVVEEPEQAAYFTESALSNNALLREAHLQAGLALENVKMQRADFFPQVAAMGAASFYDWQVSSMLPRWVVGVGASFKLFDGLAREHNYSAAKHALRGVEQAVVKAEGDVVLLVESAHAEMSSQLALLRSVESSMRFVEEYLRTKRAAFSQGMAVASDLIDAELNLAKVRIERLEAAYRFDVALARLLELAGKSDEFTDYINRADARAIIF